MSTRGNQLKLVLGITALVSFYGIASLAVVFLGPSIGLTYVWEIVIIALLLLTWPFAILINHWRKRPTAKREAAAPEAAPTQAAPAKSGDIPKRIHEVNEAARHFYVVGGTLRRDAPSYVTRQADDDLYESLSVGQVCYLLTSRQMGKSSLMVRTAIRLRADGVSVAVLDLTALGQNLSAEQWYQGLLGLIGEQLNLEDELEDFWIANKQVGPLRRWMRAIREVVMTGKQGRIIVFVDEIDAVRSLPFSTDEFFAGIRQFYNQRAEDSEMERLVFCLLGVATPSDLIRDPRTTPFNIGRRIELTDFTESEASPLTQGFGMEEEIAGPTLNRILYWTGGHPYLTQRLCQAVAENGGANLRGVDRITESLFMSPRARERDDNLLFVRDRLLRAGESDRVGVLDLYAKVLRQERLRDDEANPLISVLRLSGIVRAADGYLFVRNRIYGEVFDSEWVAGNMPGGEVRRQKVAYREGQIHAVSSVASAAMAVVLVFAIVWIFGMIVSFVANQKLVAEATDRGMRMDQITRRAEFGKDVFRKDPTSARLEIEALDALRDQLSVLDAGPPLYMRFGLYSGNDIAPSLRIIFFEGVEERFKKPTVAALESDLRNFVAGFPSETITNTRAGGSDQSSSPSEEDVLGRHYDLLKAYLMLSNASRVEPGFLANTLADYWKRTAPPDTENLSLLNLDFYARQLVRDDAPHIRVDDSLVEDARRKLAAYPPVNRFYKQLVTEINARISPISLDSVLEGRGRGVLIGTYTVPGSFTIDGYRNYIKSAIENAGKQIRKDDWVMGAAASTQVLATDINKPQEMYLHDYTDQWRKFVRGISIQKFTKKDNAVEALKALSSTDSPMERVMSAVALNTHISNKPESTGIWGWIKSWFVSRIVVTGNTEVEREFKPLFQFVSSGQVEKDSSPMSQYRAELRRVLDPLEGASENQLQQTSQLLLTGGEDKMGLTKAEQTVSNLLEAFKTAAATDTANLLKMPLQNLRSFLYGGGEEQIVKAWTLQVYPKAHQIESGYPFTDSGEASLTDLGSFLNPSNGQLWAFFNNNLTNSVEELQGQWKLKDTGAVPLSDDFMKYLNSARKLREAMFPNGEQEPKVSYVLMLQPTPNADVVIEIDGNRVESRGNAQGSTTFIWPAKSGNSGARIMVSGGQEAVQTFPGTWGLFKMMDASSKASTATDQIELSWTMGAKQVRATLRPASLNNPFQRALFRNLRAPQNLFH